MRPAVLARIWFLQSLRLGASIVLDRYKPPNFDMKFGGFLFILNVVSYFYRGITSLFSGGDSPMHETQRTAKDLIADMLSGDRNKLWQASCELRSLSQNHDRMMEIAHYKYRLKFATKRILSVWPPNTPQQLCLLKIFESIEFHRKNMGCPCCLLGEEDNPHHVVEDDYFDLLQTVPYTPECTINDYYILRCRRCGVTYKVFEREYHCLWWDWHRLEDKNGSTKKAIQTD